MAVFNAVRYVGEAVESVLRQSMTDFEFLIIDDGSTDGSTDVLRRFAEQDSRIWLKSRPNTGACGAWNEALEKATGKFVARIDADDVALPERFACQLKFLRENPDCVAVGTQAMLIDSCGRNLRTMSRQPCQHDAIDQAHLAGEGAAILHPTAMIRRAAMTEIGGYREFSTTADLDLFLRLAECGRLANLPEILLKYRIVPTSLSRMRKEQGAEFKRQMIADALSRRGCTADVASLTWNAQADRGRVDRIRAGELLLHGNRAAARRHALSALMRSPLNGASWRVATCACLDERTIGLLWRMRDALKSRQRANRPSRD